MVSVSQARARLSSPARGAARKAQLALLAGAGCIAFAPILVRLSQVGPAATAFWRLSLALPLLVLWMGLENRASEATRRPVALRDYSRLVLAGLLFAGDLLVWHWSIRYTSVANATLLPNFAPIFVTMGGWLLLGQRIGWLFILGMVVALSGTSLVVGANLALSPERLLGDGLGLVTAVFYAAYLLSIKHLRRDFATATVMTWSSATAGAVLLPVVLLSGEALTPKLLSGWLALGVLALLSQVGGQGLIAFALAQLPASFSSVTLLVQPAMATVLAWLILGETLNLTQVLGGGLVVAGILVARRGSPTG